MAVCHNAAVRRIAALVAAAALASACGSPERSSSGDASQEMGQPPAPGTITRGDSSTDLTRTPLSAADYALYTAIMGGASALLNTITPEDREALEFARAVDQRKAQVTPATQPLLTRARALQQKDLELARLQGIEARYSQVKEKIESVIGPRAKPPAPDDAVARENLRYLEAHRDNIERLQRIVNDPLSRNAPPGGESSRN